MRKLPLAIAGMLSLTTALSVGIGLGAAAQQVTKNPDPTATARATAVATASDEAPFLSENDTAMTKMMAGMAAKPTGNIDHDFVAMMEPHHQGAIDMAEIELRYGKNEQLRRIAQEIIVDQLQEIAAMRLALGEPLPPSIASPTGSTPPTSPAPSKPSDSMSSMVMSPAMPMK